ncbi:class D sortase (plasmid) [Clostridium perfringens]|uniref:class D sortase n=1 Tax=Clostridium perfringens TaxID=1502 RepID=UPI001CCC2F82|nr:class D sortase [Clostridium perfringens]MDU7141727.1 class D sortase [Anaerococcus vaginalis]MDU7977741.1 class D sortase [Clostridioides difficile]MDU3376166.1 class D sortase [Clostridium perfringens]MDU3536167.1 class D sortase [Clostridium perfringens]MDU3774735.1 class D sortase [Clostridium perfringens]
MKRKEVIFGIVIIIGLLLIAIPIGNNLRAAHIENKMVSDFKDTLNKKNIINNTKNSEEYVSDKKTKEEDYSSKPNKNVIALLSISSIGLKDAPILDGEDNLNYTIGKYSNTPKFGEHGNVVLAAHNNMAGSIFRHLKDVSNGDIIKVQTKENVIFKYKIVNKYVVEPNDSSVIDQDDSKQEITLITCTNHAKQRLIVKGVLI